MAKLGKFFGEVNAEMKKTTWPWDPKEKGVKKYKTLIDSTLLVIIAMIIMGAYVAVVDFGLHAFISLLTTGKV